MEECTTPYRTDTINEKIPIKGINPQDLEIKDSSKLKTEFTIEKQPLQREWLLDYTENITVRCSEVDYTENIDAPASKWTAHRLSNASVGVHSFRHFDFFTANPFHSLCGERVRCSEVDYTEKILAPVIWIWVYSSTRSPSCSTILPLGIMALPSRFTIMIMVCREMSKSRIR